MKQFALLIFLGSIICTAGTGVLEDEKPPFPSFNLGLSLETMIPNLLPDFDQSVTTYGPILSYYLGADRLELHTVYGSSERFSLILSELDYRYQMTSPFLSPYVLAGFGFMKYWTNREDHAYVSPLLGIGLDFTMVKNFNVSLGAKIYLPVKTILCFGGQFLYSI